MLCMNVGDVVPSRYSFSAIIVFGVVLPDWILSLDSVFGFCP